MIKMRKKRQKNGFTLVELLTVVALLSLLSTSMLASLELVRQKARDARRLEDANSMITALQLYYDTEGHFPCPVQYTADFSFFQELVDRGYISGIPRDPGSNHYYYSSFHNVPNPDPPALPSPCGQIFHIDMDFEDNTSACPFGGFKSGSPTHCHIYYPTGIPTNFPPPDDCSDPYQQYGCSQACNNFFDVTLFCS